MDESIVSLHFSNLENMEKPCESQYVTSKRRNRFLKYDGNIYDLENMEKPCESQYVTSKRRNRFLKYDGNIYAVLGGRGQDGGVSGRVSVSSAARAYSKAQRSRAPSSRASLSVWGALRRSGGREERPSKWRTGRRGLPDRAAGGPWGTHGWRGRPSRARGPGGTPGGAVGGSLAQWQSGEERLMGGVRRQLSSRGGTGEGPKKRSGGVWLRALWHQGQPGWALEGRAGEAGPPLAPMAPDNRCALRWEE
ncbi:hypothetical protein NDU88_007910 [Pleurodeles waltl]|uniref:Uncharacterized protein n=1 Tax=Pleurodeles waltl TaxID=8319 RepID=A0AAV7QM00_PLEWA|nr:hypothetical protein NDU88_007910 [Pleurodeles waltl]